jgi:glutaryl-CoA dehydrogenase
VADWFERGEIDDIRGLAREFGKLGLLGMHLRGTAARGCPRSSTAWRVWNSRRLTPGIRSLVSVQGSLAMFAIWRLGFGGAETAVAAPDGHR